MDRYSILPNIYSNLYTTYLRPYKKQIPSRFIIGTMISSKKGYHDTGRYLPFFTFRIINVKMFLKWYLFQLPGVNESKLWKIKDITDFFLNTFFNILTLWSCFFCYLKFFGVLDRLRWLDDLAGLGDLDLDWRGDDDPLFDLWKPLDGDFAEDL